MKNLFTLVFILCTSYCLALDVAYYDQIKDLPNHPEILLIDVREVYEIEATGLIPTSINIPGENYNEFIEYFFI